MATAPAALTRRDRARIATVDEIKTTALDLMREQGTTDVRFTDIARVMGMTAPALYRYFDDRDELLTALITDGYRALGARIAAALEPLPEDDIAGRWVAAAGQLPRVGPQRAAAVRAGARACRSRLRRARRGPDHRGGQGARWASCASMFVAAARTGRLGAAAHHRGRRSPSRTARRPSTTSWSASIPPESFQAMLQTWAMLHGFVSLEAYGHFDWLEPEARDALFRSHIRLAAKAAGLPVPAP